MPHDILEVSLRKQLLHVLAGARVVNLQRARGFAMFQSCLMFVVSEVFKGFKACGFSKSKTLKELAVSKHVQAGTRYQKQKTKNVSRYVLFRQVQDIII